jgi:hypothetical protein
MSPFFELRGFVPELLPAPPPSFLTRDGFRPEEERVLRESISWELANANANATRHRRISSPGETRLREGAVARNDTSEFFANGSQEWSR